VLWSIGGLDGLHEESDPAGPIVDIPGRGAEMIQKFDESLNPYLPGYHMIGELDGAYDEAPQP